MEASLITGREIIQIDIGEVSVKKLAAAIEDVSGDFYEAQVVSSVVLHLANDV